jgi:topoisomerase-4 subunit B
MNPEQLKETAMSTDTRRLLRVRAPKRDAAQLMFDMLMAKKASGDRRVWMESKGYSVEADV